MFYTLFNPLNSSKRNWFLLNLGLVLPMESYVRYFNGYDDKLFGFDNYLSPYFCWSCTNINIGNYLINTVLLIVHFKDIYMLSFENYFFTSQKLLKIEF